MCICEDVIRFKMPYAEIKRDKMFDHDVLPFYMFHEGHKWYLQTEWGAKIGRLRIHHCPKCGKKL